MKENRAFHVDQTGLDQIEPLQPSGSDEEQKRRRDLKEGAEKTRNKKMSTSRYSVHVWIGQSSHLLLEVCTSL